MCDSCPDCPECGQTMYQSAGLNYLAGLLLPVFIYLAVAEAAHRFDYISAELYWATLGATAMAGWALLITDRHRFVFQWRSPEADDA